MARIRPSRAGERSEAGFTLTELLVVLAVMGLLLVATPILISSAMPGLRSASVAASLADELRAARADAIAHGTVTRVVFVPQRQIYIREPDGAAHALPEGIRFAMQTRGEVGGDASAIGFNPDGSSSGGTVEVGDTKWRKRVTVDWLTGRVSVSD